MFFGGPANMIFTNSDLPSIPMKEKNKKKRMKIVKKVIKKKKKM